MKKFLFFISSLFALFPVSVLLAAEADLIITDVWNDGGIIRYQLLNIGEVKVGSPFECQLFIDGSYAGTDFVNLSIEAGERVDRFFDKYTFQCSECSDQVKVIADSGNDVVELDEKNNDRFEQWLCDDTVPEITISPYTSGITGDSVTIKWSTDQYTDSSVSYSRFEDNFDNNKADGTLVQDHEIKLTGLAPATTYNYVAESSNSCGVTVTGKTGYFRTLPEAGIGPPKILSHVKSSRYWPMEFTSDIEDINAVEKVAFYLDGNLVETDYSEPYQFIFDPLWLDMSKADFLQNHEIRAEAIGPGGLTVSNSIIESPWSFCGPVEFDFRGPYDGYEVLVYGDAAPAGTELSVLIEASESEWIETENRYGITMIQGSPAERIEFWFEGAKIFEEYETTMLTGELDISGLTVGSYEAVAKVYTHDCGMVRQETHTINIAPQRDDLNVESRFLHSEGNYFTVRMTLRNHAPGLSRIIDVTDTLRGFQVIDASTGDYTVRGEYNPYDKVSTVEIEFTPSMWITGWSEYEIEYKVVPIIYKDFDPYCLGVEDTTWNYEHYTDGLTIGSRSIRREGPFLNRDVNAAIKTADYLIVTSPQNLFAVNNNYEDVRQLLVKMAELAALRNGVLGYFNSNSIHPTHYDSSDKIASGFIVDDTIDPGNQVVLLDDENDKIRIYNEYKQLLYLDWPGLSSGDAVDTGNITFHYGTLSHPFDEIVVACNEGVYDGWVVVFRASLDGTSLFNIPWGFDCGYSHGDGMAVGNVLTYDDEEEIVLADKDSGDITVYKSTGSSAAVESVISGTAFRSGDVLLTADIIGDSADEIIVADKSADTVYVYSASALLGSVAFLMSGNDEIFTADVWGNGKEELIIADDESDKILYASIEDTGSGLNLTYRGVVNHYIHADDSFCAGNISNLAKAQIVIARGRTTQNHNRGEMEFLRIDGGKALDRYAFNDLINEHGQWAEKLADGWAADGYLLIVGETEIIPAYARDYGMWYLEDAGKSTRRVEYTDSYYASTDDDPHRPDLNIGRIVGDTASLLTVPIQTSIDLALGVKVLDNSNALVSSGHPRGSSGTADEIDFASERRSISSRLEGMGFDTLELNEPGASELLTAALNKDVIYLAAHGNWNYCDPVNSGNVDDLFDPNNTNNTSPLVYADSCTTGRYPNGYSLAEAFLGKGASAYIGATRSAFSPYCKWLGTRFCDRIDNGIDLGSAFKDARRNVLSAGDHWWEDGRVWFVSGMFHYFGDPKIKVSGLPLPLSASTVGADGVESGFAAPIENQADAAAGGITGNSINTPGISTEYISVPMYTASDLNGIDTVEIPDGQMLTVIGNPEVPVYSVEYPIGQGLYVTDVKMVERSQVITDTGLNLLIVEPLEPGQGSSSAPPADSGEEWFPARNYDWHVSEEAGGGRALIITTYPFNYNRNRMVSEFYQNYTFEIITASSTVEIVYFDTDKVAYEPNEIVLADIHLNNTSGQGQDVIIAGIIKNADQAVVNLQLKTLSQVNGFATFSYSWDSSQDKSNDYTWHITLKTPAGRILDKAKEEFTVGGAYGQITDINVAPACFAANEDVSINIDFENKGSRALDSKAVIEIWDDSDMKIFESSRDMNDIPSGQTVQCPFVWQSTVNRGECRIIAYAIYDGQAADLKIWPEIETGLEGDLNNDNKVDFADFAVLAAGWLEQDQQSICDIAPAGGDCIVNLIDLSLMSANWLVDNN